MISSRTHRLLLLSKVPGVGRKALQALARDNLLYELSVELLHEEFRQLASFRPGTRVWQEAHERADKDVDEASRRGHFILSIVDPKYPRLMSGVSDRPALLYVRGNVANLTDRAIAVVGTRQPSEHGIRIAERITSFFCDSKYQIISGLAKGIDTIAHATAVTKWSSTVAVLAHGLEHVYPKENVKLADAIVESGGLLLSEYPYFTKSFPGNFVERDRIQAALARAVIMVQSDVSGGSWHASRAALQYGRHLFIPEPTSQDIASGYPKTEGALKIMRDSPSDVATFLRCPEHMLSRLRMISGKHEYADLLSLVDQLESKS